MRINHVSINLATASYDGQVIVWNMVSGHIFAFLDAPSPPENEDQSCKYKSSHSELSWSGDSLEHGLWSYICLFRCSQPSGV